MPPLAKLMIPLAFAITLQSAHAQMLGLESDTNVTLTQADLDMIKTALAQQIHGKKPGASAAWSDPTSGNSGTLRLQKVFSRQGQRCEQIEYQLHPPEKGKLSDRYALISCLQPDGAWKLSY